MCTALFFLNSADLAKFETRLGKEFKTVAKQGQKPFEGIDLDLLLSLLLKEFIDCRARILKNLKAKYFKLYEVEKGFIRTDQFKKIYFDIRKDYQTNVEGWEHPCDIYLDRALLYSLTSNENTLNVEVNNFATACHRFGLDSPFPVVLKAGKSTPNQNTE